jgi:ergothioneine biosynthesis protein EgtB
VKEYVSRVRKELDAQIEANLGSEPGKELEFSPAQLLNTAIEHRLMHAETLAYMLHQLPLEQKVRKERSANRVEAAALTPKMIQIPGGSITLGLPRDSGLFGWDNEYESHVVKVPPFAIDQYPVTNGEYEEFVRAGGYDDRSLWNEADWNWKTEAKVSHPIFWKPAGAGWLYRTMFDEVPLPAQWPVYVSMAEASAYAKWKGKTLPTEAQWNRAAYAMPDGLERQYPWGDESPSAELGNFDFFSWDPVPVGSSPRGQSGFGVADMLGNGWEWTSTVFGPYPGFKRFPFYPGYSADFFDGHHYVMKGGSAQTAACMLRRSFRNWFQPHYQYVYAGFRCVSS